eukprot:896940_1
MSQNSSKDVREDSVGGTGQISLLASGTSNSAQTEEDAFNPYGLKSKSPIGSVTSSFMSSTTSEARNLNMHLLQGNTDRSWIDPWEMTPSAKYYTKNYESPTRHL